MKLVVAVARTKYTNLVSSKRIGINRMTIPDNVEWEEIHIKIPAQLTITHKTEEKSDIYIAQLRFLTCTDMNTQGHYAWRVCLNGGQYLLLGTGNRPFATMEITETYPADVKDNQLNEVLINYSHPQPIPYIEV